MEKTIKTQSNLAKFIVAAGFVGFGATAIGAAALAQPAMAAEATPAHTVSYPVGYSDLDVSTVKGARTLYLRIRHAAETVCEGAATWGKSEREACVNKAVNEAVARIDAPQLTQYNQLRSKGNDAGLVQLAKAT
jgi:UrcA family protein